jgi:hypothetical protein
MLKCLRVACQFLDEREYEIMNSLLVRPQLFRSAFSLIAVGNWDSHSVP